MNILLVSVTLTLLISLVNSAIPNNKQLLKLITTPEPEVTTETEPTTKRYVVTTTRIPPEARRKPGLFPKNPSRYIISHTPKINNEFQTKLYASKRTLMPKLNIKKTTTTTTTVPDLKRRVKARPLVLKKRVIKKEKEESINYNEETVKVASTPKTSLKNVDITNSSKINGSELQTQYVGDKQVANESRIVNKIVSPIDVDKEPNDDLLAVEDKIVSVIVSITNSTPTDSVNTNIETNGRNKRSSSDDKVLQDFNNSKYIVYPTTTVTNDKYDAIEFIFIPVQGKKVVITKKNSQKTAKIENKSHEQRIKRKVIEEEPLPTSRTKYLPVEHDSRFKSAIHYQNINT